jgi:PadR family transcriptional regulator, regulatory protein PadR
MTAQTLKVLAVFLADTDAEWYGFSLADQTKIKSGTLYPILIRLEQAGWLASRLEDIDPKIVGRPPRRLYTLTGKGERAARRERAAHLEALAPVLKPVQPSRERLA